MSYETLKKTLVAAVLEHYQNGTPLPEVPSVERLICKCCGNKARWCGDGEKSCFIAKSFVSFQVNPLSLWHLDKHLRGAIHLTLPSIYGQITRAGLQN